MSVLSIPELNTEIYFLQKFDEIKFDFSSSILFYDQKLEDFSVVKDFISKAGFHHSFALEAGEELKTLGKLSWVIDRNGESFRTVPSKKPSFVAMGGGSIGDFVGFLASIYQRGSQLIQIPSTWLSAIDSSHGGKTALNTSTGKNQIGSFHQASQVFIIGDLLFTQPQELFYDSVSEIIKMYMLIEDERKYFLKNDSSPEEIFSAIKHCVEQKYLWVKKDPQEKFGIREVLNLGHTLGHAFEKVKEMSHGSAIAMGLCFCVRYSFAKGKLNQERFSRLASIFQGFGWWDRYQALLRDLSSDQVKSFLMADKKRTSYGCVNYVFLTEHGHCIEEVSVEELSSFLKKEIMNV